ncbi:hypothetical protein [Staphylococcus equorum]|uniref:hypothetical protein n=1 Tax=Staphylococcus equorum TaxID=246432 RepID=UPI0018666616|nr:hypothetical protein [Staphylococcus equorum]
MAFKKTQNYLTISKTKSEQIVDLVTDELHWSVLSEKLDYTRYKAFDCKKNLRTRYNEIKEANEEKDNSAFEALAEVFTIKEMNIVISIFNDYIEAPEKYEKPRKKKEIDLDKQEQAIRKNMKDFQSDLAYERGSESVDEPDKKEQGTKQEETPKDKTKQQVLEEHEAKVKQQQEEIKQLPKGSPERAKKEAEFQRSKADRMEEFWASQKKGK